ncbi:MAG: prolyl oligopeptidase family serine peptidase, partial [bacterium]|nr:prolyl oligopeptidase family serine peptidase [bacterium]
MTHHFRNTQMALAGIFILLMLPALGNGLEKNHASAQISISTWLTLGPIETPLPVFHETKNIKGNNFDLKSLLKFEQVPFQNWNPQTGSVVPWDRSKSLHWQPLKTDEDGFIFLPKIDGAVPQVYYFAVYLEAKRWLKIKSQLFSHHLCQIYLDHKMIAEKSNSEKSKNDSTTAEPGTITQDLKLEMGKHLFFVKLLGDPDNKNPIDLKVILTMADPWQASDIAIDTLPREFMTITHLLDGPKISSASISPDGELVAISLRQTMPPTDESESWIEIRRATDGSMFQTLRGGMKVSSIQWAPTGKRFSYTNSNKEGTTLWIVDLQQGTSIPLLQNIKDLGGHSWAPNGNFIIYEISESAEPAKSGLKKLEGMPDRLPGWRERSFLYSVNLPEGTRRRLTSGLLSTNLNGISPDSKKLLFSRSVEDFSERPYSKTEFLLLDLKTMQLDSLWTNRWGGSVQWSPDGKTLLVTGAPSLFGDLGVNVPAGMIPNDYDTQTYLYDLATKKIEPISRQFDPAIGGAIWSKTENCIYFNTTDKSCRHLYRYDLARKKFDLIELGIEVLDRIDLADQKPIAVYTGSSAAVPHKAYVIDLKTKKFRLLADPQAEDYQNVRFGKVERWTFTNARKKEIDGHIYYPPDFDSEKKYPCIVYYYGGTSPVTRDFGGRYPKELYAALGYIVYVLQPSGATGFGQEFSALHVNDWGKIVADEIIDGTKQFLAAHPFVDEKRVGCIGASFGGFMTMLLLTRTDIFAAGISHAGISSISSYWGEGYWGYEYSAVATANSFPWNRPDIYIDQSALFHADKIKTPLLLLHGAVDTNV